ncbi:MAG: DNA recombination protein RmuC, partial [Cytophagales bacterium]|nr:DNA recombination protein RmuC [Cytophagales bacterium]
KEIRDKYISPHLTTEFAIMYLPTEGLYAEICREPGLLEKLRKEFKILPAGPVTLSPFLNMIKMGYVTLNMQKKSSEVWAVLEEVRSEFAKFSDALTKVQDKIQGADKELNTLINTRTNAMNRKLNKFEALPHPEGSAGLPKDSNGSLLGE